MSTAFVAWANKTSTDEWSPDAYAEAAFKAGAEWALREAAEELDDSARTCGRKSGSCHNADAAVLRNQIRNL